MSRGRIWFIAAHQTESTDLLLSAAIWSVNSQWHIQTTRSPTYFIFLGFFIASHLQERKSQITWKALRSIMTAHGNELQPSNRPVYKKRPRKCHRYLQGLLVDCKKILKYLLFIMSGEKNKAEPQNATKTQMIRYYILYKVGFVVIKKICDISGLHRFFFIYFGKWWISAWS